MLQRVADQDIEQAFQHADITEDPALRGKRAEYMKVADRLSLQISRQHLTNELHQIKRLGRRSVQSGFDPCKSQQGLHGAFHLGTGVGNSA